MGLEHFVLNRGVSLLEGFVLTEIKALVTEFTVLIRSVLLRGVSANRGFTVFKSNIDFKFKLRFLSSHSRKISGY